MEKIIIRMEVMMKIISRSLLKKSGIFIYVILILISKNAFAEDPSPIKLKNPIKYTDLSVDKYRNVVTSSLEIERISAYKIKFVMETVINEHVCDLSGEANSTAKNERDFEFVYYDCHLHMIISADDKTIVSSDSENACPQYFCGFQGRIDGFVFRR